ncbi:MAG: hypothetical protein ABSA77_09030 [Thermoguttaceae bacterium]
MFPDPAGRRGGGRRDRGGAGWRTFAAPGVNAGPKTACGGQRP